MSKVLIVGGVAGGASTAARLRRLDENIEIIMFERGEYISFANCGLPYYIGETIKDRQKLLVQTPEAMKNRFNIDVRINSDVVSVDAENKTIKVISKEDGEYEEKYDFLVLSPGAKPFRPAIEGINSEKIYSVRNVPDTDKIKAVIDDGSVKRATVIGGGFIGIEMAENLKERGIDVTLVEAAPHILAPFDSEMASIIEKELQENGVNLVLNNGVEKFIEEDKEIITLLKSGESLISDMVIFAIGVTPDTSFLKDSGIKLGERGHIIVDKHMRTSEDGIFAAGDAILVKDYVNGSDVAIPLAGPANRQGRIIADNIAGIESSYNGSMGTSILKIFSMAAAATGNNERNLQRLGIEYRVVYAHPMTHASYYPGATQLSIKLLYDLDGKVLGAQAVGYDGVDKFIDVIATVIKFKGTIEDLTELELAYAPPFLSAKSPANMVGFIAQNNLRGAVELFTIDELKDFDGEKATLLDVRDKVEVENGIISGAINIPVNDLRERYNELDKNKEIYIYCAVGLRGYIASRILTQNGFKVKNLTGGYKTFSQSIFKPINKEEKNRAVKDFNEKEEAMDKVEEKDVSVTELDATGLCCPGPLMRLKDSMDNLNEGDILSVKASDPGFYEDVKAWTSRTGNELIKLSKMQGIVQANIKKGKQVSNDDEKLKNGMDNCSLTKNDGKTMVVFSGDLDKAIASFIIANGAAAMGKKVTMFFTFWGLNILRKHEKVDVKKNVIEKAFGFMMPRGSKKLGLSNMNMGGMGAKMIRKVMKDKNIQSLEDLMEAAIKNGVNVVACTMSMDVMGITKEELIDGITYAGVGYYLGEAEDANVNLFI
ncbi:NADPH-dependent 2,4-dienoyl-CoA reductase, sulfur reductase [Clostridium cavendishii DSM 21758]|uniref:NADPH-dependent 2,4-dienoyl-CoA reductase, sulfur reductase n=1 Tax=Clostridium cavendishii DSM 21758 TaxID=1121302 RepID=A0A1M6Q3R3_9CLOT|nr:DsrE/DsrF/DrsH-like family protein [Clostridium cavendishii]SHK14862.1 NADPH-dependent 2,4-dienoyl-CoA reductase, sulfur reductase [Clostridium cavendishii DSM 21758]